VFTITITAALANGAPVNALPATPTILEDTLLTLSGASHISISDPDAGSNNVRVTLQTAGGTTRIGTTGITVAGNGTAAVTATGSIVNLNAALNSLVFTPAANGNGTPGASIVVITNDLGNIGTGGNQVDTDTLSINITSENDAPSFVKGP